MRELQQRLSAAGFLAPHAAQDGEFCSRTHAALLAFQEAYGLRVDGECDDATWSMLTEATWNEGDRILSLRTPNLRGDDVASLQNRLSRLGFDCGRVDGIFGPRTVRALTEFQQNAGLTADGVCTPEVVAVLQRVGTQSGSGPGIATVREAESLTRASTADRRRIVIGQFGAVSHIGHAVGRLLRLRHPLTITVDGDVRNQSQTANSWGAEVYIGIESSTDESCSICYYEVPSFVSVGGRSLAHRITESLSSGPTDLGPRALGLRLPILRETRMPAVLCTIGPLTTVLQHATSITDAIVSAVDAWLAQPLTPEV